MPGATRPNWGAAQTRRVVFLPFGKLATAARERPIGRVKRGRKRNEEEAEINQLRQENQRLTQRLEQAELIIEAQKKLSEILGVTLTQPKRGQK